MICRVAKSGLYLVRLSILSSNCDQQRSVSLEIKSNDFINLYLPAIYVLDCSGGLFLLLSAYTTAKSKCNSLISSPTGPLTIPPRFEPLDLVLRSSQCLTPVFFAYFPSIQALIQPKMQSSWPASTATVSPRLRAIPSGWRPFYINKT